MRYRVEYLNDHGDWIVSSRHQNQSSAIVNAEVKAQAGRSVRIVHDGKIVWEG